DARASWSRSRSAVLVGARSSCDFCHARDVAWVFPCAEFEVPAVSHLLVLAGRRSYRGGWRACGPCGERIRPRELPGLVARASGAASASALGPELPETLGVLAAVFQAFLAHRTTDLAYRFG